MEERRCGRPEGLDAGFSWEALAARQLLTAEKRYLSRGIVFGSWRATPGGGEGGGHPLHCFWEFSRSEVNNAAGSGLAEEEGSTGALGWLEFVSCSLLEGL